MPGRFSLLITCSMCSHQRPAGPKSLLDGNYTCRPCRKVRRESAKPELGWNCVVCGAYIKRATGPIGLYCQEHKRPASCKTCGLQFRARSSERIYCSDNCKPTREPATRFTLLDWKTCPCGIWICKRGKKYCSSQCKIEAQAANGPCRNRDCRQCKSPLGYFSRKHICDQCSASNLRDRKRKERKDPNRRALNNHRHRARHYGVDYEPVKRSAIYERDAWRCGICSLKVDRRLKYPHPKSPSLDHVIPMALGGGHTYINVQCAHLICNSRKSHHGTGDQLALIG
jgi:hypothetical protein